MNKRIKKKYSVEKHYYYKTQMIIKNSIYNSGFNKPSELTFMLFYNANGNNSWFKSLGQAKRYIDKNKNQYEAYEKESAKFFETKFDYKPFKDEIDEAFNASIKDYREAIC
jgi:hypothetical protein